MADARGSGRVISWWRSIGGEGASQPPSEWRATLRSRLVVCVVVFGVWTAGIEARLLYLQVIQYDDLMEKAKKQQQRTVKTPARRGAVVDRNGELLAFSADAVTVGADPGAIDDRDAVAAAVCAAVDDCDAAQRGLMAERLRKNVSFASLVRQISVREAERVRALKLPGLVFYRESRRYYPKRELAAHVLGFVGVDNVGLAGIESAYDSRIRGRIGQTLVQNDARRQAMFSREDRPPTAGDSVELTIDQYLQHIAERELQAGVKFNNAAGGTAIIMDPASGEILALANYPTFNPNAFSRVDEKTRRNRATQETYEPGSTFKVVTASAALQEHVIVPDDLVDCNPGYITFGSRVIRDTHQNGVLPFTDVIVKSSNVGAIKVGLRLGADRLSEYVGRFGFGQTLAPDFRGESAGIVWRQLDAGALASVSMGYQVSVTPLQMATAVSSVANGGSLIEPRVVRAFIRNGRREAVARRVLRQSVTPETAATLTDIMEQVVERGTGTAAQVAGYTVAGKTGTAAKLVNGRYSTSDYNASFVGFAPSRKPAVTIIVVIDSPHGRGYYGGTVAAPVFQRIAEASLRHLGVPTNINPVTPVIVARHEPEPEIVPRPVALPSPEPPSAVEPAHDGLMPDLRGLSAREALRIATGNGLAARVVGAGVVVDQQPKPGTVLTSGGTSVLTLGRRSAAVERGQQP